MFESWLRAPVVALIREVLDAKGASVPHGPLLVVGDAALAVGLTRNGYDVHVAGVRARAQKRFANVVAPDVFQAPPGTPVFANAVTVVPSEGSFAVALTQAVPLMVPRGYVMLVTRGQRAAAAGVALGAGLLAIEQRQAGRYVVTSGTRAW